ncbi:hypothetical protein PTKIN_Ptkin05aG0111400 [Pterospermum kingtungense]
MIVLEPSKNSLSGKIPDCLRVHQDRSFRVVIQQSFGCYPQLYRASFLANMNWKALRFLYLGENALSGNVPTWIGDSFRYLTVLRLRENRFNGSIPLQLCQLSTDLRILDLAENKLKGRIPHCIGNLTAMVLPKTNEVMEKYKHLLWWEEEHLNEVMKGNYLEYTTTLQFLVTIDFSRNNLEGLIPEELTILTGLICLNLSHNHLSGKIPGKLGELELLESLDLSVNELSGMIPDSMSSMTRLSYLNLSYNNFSGKTPKGNQLQTLVVLSIYAGNPLLCGASLLEKCPHQENKDNGEDNHAEEMWFYFVIMSGFATGFWGVVGVLLFKRTWRHAYFLFLDRCQDRVLVLVELKMASLKNMIKGNST